MSKVGQAVGFASGVLALLCAGPLFAQDPAAAQALFDRGVLELEAGRFDQACPALAESHRLDPLPGTLFALAECEAKAGKLASAVGHYQDYLGLMSRMTPEQLERHAERAATARARVEALRPSVPTLTLVVPPGAPSALVVERDGVALHGPALGMALPVDPGEHVVVTRLPGGGERRVALTLVPGEARRVELELPAAAAPEPARSAAPASARDGEQRTLRTWGWALGAVGLSGVIAGSVTGVMVLQKKATVTDHCDGSACDREGKEAADSGKTLAAVSTVSFGVGLSAVAASIVILIVTEPRTPAPPPAGFVPRLNVGSRGVWAGLEREF
jgi:hypothetical protein